MASDMTVVSKEIAAHGQAIQRVIDKARAENGWVLIAIRGDGSADIECHLQTTWVRSGRTVAEAVEQAFVRRGDFPDPTVR